MLMQNLVGRWGHENPQDPICASSRNELEVVFPYCLLFWVSKLQIYIALFTRNYDYVALYHYVKDLLPMKSLIEEVIDNLVFYSKNLKLVSRATFYEGNNGTIVLSTSPIMTSV